MTNQQIIIDNKKRTVSSAKIKNAAPDVFAVRTHLFGQFDDIGFSLAEGCPFFKLQQRGLIVCINMENDKPQFIFQLVDNKYDGLY